MQFKQPLILKKEECQIMETLKIKINFFLKNYDL
jgi:hypothetical protein